MAYIITVLVQMPDSSFRRLPIAAQRGNDYPEVVKHDTASEAYDWAEDVLSERAEVISEEDMENLKKKLLTSSTYGKFQ